jgi:hypothetical protein
VPARALPNQGEPNIWRSFSPPPFCPAVGEKSDRMTKKLARIPEFGFNPNPRPRPWSTPKFWLGSFGLQSKQTLNFHSRVDVTCSSYSTVLLHLQLSRPSSDFVYFLVSYRLSKKIFACLYTMFCHSKYKVCSEKKQLFLRERTAEALLHNVYGDTKVLRWINEPYMTTNVQTGRHFS